MRGWNQQHVDKHKKLSNWIKDKNAYLNVEEKVASMCVSLLYLAID